MLAPGSRSALVDGPRDPGTTGTRVLRVDVNARRLTTAVTRWNLGCIGSKYDADHLMVHQ